MGWKSYTGMTNTEKTVENLWKNKLRTFRPYGVNTKE
jgi:hypothetical protein